MKAFIQAFDEFAREEYLCVLRCYQLADPEDESETDDDAVEEACEQATTRYFVTEDETEGAYHFFVEPSFEQMIWDWDEECMATKQALTTRKAFKASLHPHPLSGEVCRFVTSGTALLHQGPEEIDLVLDFARVGGQIKCIASWSLCRACYGTGFVDGYGSKKTPGVTQGTVTCTWIDEYHRDPDKPARQCRDGLDFNGGLLLTAFGPATQIQRFAPPTGMWMHQALFETD